MTESKPKPRAAFTLRLPPALDRSVDKLRKASRRSKNAEITVAVEEHVRRRQKASS